MRTDSAVIPQGAAPSAKAAKMLDRAKRRKDLRKDIRKNWDLYLFVLPAVLLILIFAYFPLYGLQIAFKYFSPAAGIFGSPWCGFDHFTRFFNSYQFWNILWNTISISFYDLIAGFPVPIILALLLNQTRSKVFRKSVQMVTYAPYFISTVVMVAMIMLFLDPKVGIINQIIVALGGEAIAFMEKPEYYQTIYVLSNIWQGAGWSSIIYLAALSGISSELHEAAIVDGASKWRRIWHIDLPGILPTVVIMLIMRSGQILNVGFEKVFLMQNALNLPVSNIISTYVYEMGIRNTQYDFATAVGLFNSLVNLILLVTVNQVSKKVSEVSLW